MRNSLKASLVLTWVLLANLLTAAEPLQFATARISESENRWVVLPTAKVEAHTFGFIYVDPEAGFTFNLEGSFKIGADGKLQLEPNELAGKATFKSRLGADNKVGLLSETQRKELALPEVPGWMSFYKDESSPAAHGINWGRAYNHIGACNKALEFLEPVYSQIPDDEKLLFELSYAYNALGRFVEAKRVLAKGLERFPKNFFLNREYAYVLLHAQKWEEAIERYRACVELCPEKNTTEKAEVAFNLARALEGAGERKEASEWFAKAKSWAPQGSAVAEFFKRQSP